MVDHADYMAPTRQRELDRADQDASALKDVDHTDHTDHIDHTDHTGHTDHKR